MNEKKTTLPSLRNQFSKTVMVENEKQNQQIINKDLNERHTDLNELIYAGAKLICDKISVPR